MIFNWVPTILRKRTAQWIKQYIPSLYKKIHDHKKSSEIKNFLLSNTELLSKLKVLSESKNLSVLTTLSNPNTLNGLEKLLNSEVLNRLEKLSNPKFLSRLESLLLPKIPVLKQLNLKDLKDFPVALRHYPENLEVRARIGRFVYACSQSNHDIQPDLKDALCKLALPELIRIETVSACNLRCKHCTTGVAYSSTDRSTMKMHTFDILIEQLKQLPTIKTATLYLGGEPLLNKNHLLMCKRVKAETSIVKTKFVTNGMLLTQVWCNEIAEADVDSISISLDGLSPEEHNSIRVRSDYETIKRNIWMLKETLEAKGSRTALVIGNTQIMPAKNIDTPTGLPNRRAEAPEFLLKDFPGFTISSGYAMVWPGMNAEDTGISGLKLHYEKPRDTCDHPFSDLAVRANGDIVLCCYDISGKHVMGNIHRDNILELYQAPAYIELRQAMLRKDKNAVPDICKRCWNFTGATFVRSEPTACAKEAAASL